MFEAVDGSRAVAADEAVAPLTKKDIRWAIFQGLWLYTLTASVVLGILYVIGH